MVKFRKLLYVKYTFKKKTQTRRVSHILSDSLRVSYVNFSEPTGQQAMKIVKAQRTRKIILTKSKRLLTVAVHLFLRTAKKLFLKIK